MKTGIQALMALVVLATAAHAAPVGWNNDGTADFPDADPPTGFDGATGKNLKWKARLPNWSNSSPIAVGRPGGREHGPLVRVFCLSEPLDYAPVLWCFDGDTGKELWNRVLDPVPHLPEAEQEAARVLAKKQWAMQRARKALISEAEDLKQKNGSAFKGKSNNVIPEELKDVFAPLLKRGETLGCQFRGFSYSAGGYPQHFQWKDTRDPDRKRLQALGLMYSDWDTQGTWDGVAFPTPVSDGTRTYTITSQNLYSCHDVDGKVLWEKRFPPADLKDLTETQRARVKAGLGERARWPGGWPGAGHFSTSPLLRDGQLVSAAGRMLRALDATTGRELWRLPMIGAIGQCMGVPGIVKVGGADYVIGVDREGKKEGTVDIVRLKDGFIAGQLPGVTCSKGSITGPIVLGDGSVVAYSAGGTKRSDVTAWTLSPDPSGQVCVTEKWRAQAPRYFGLWRPAWRGTEIFSGTTRFDAAAGKPLNENMRARFKGGSYDGTHLLAGRYFVKVGFYAGKLAFFDMETGKPAGEGSVPVNPEDGLPLQLKREQATRTDWRWFGCGTPAAWKNRLYIRSYDFLWCFEKGE